MTDKRPVPVAHREHPVLNFRATYVPDSSKITIVRVLPHAFVTRFDPRETILGHMSMRIGS